MTKVVDKLRVVSTIYECEFGYIDCYKCDYFVMKDIGRRLTVCSYPYTSEEVICDIRAGRPKYDDE